MKACHECAELIQDKARKCRFCGAQQPEQSERPRPSGLRLTNTGGRSIRDKIGIGLLVMLLTAYALVKLSREEPVEQSVLSLATYGRLPVGASYADAVRMIGRPGEEISRVELANITTVMYSWRNQNGSNMNAMFQDGKLSSKAQFGLR